MPEKNVDLMIAGRSGDNFLLIEKAAFQENKTDQMTPAWKWDGDRKEFLGPRPLGVWFKFGVWDGYDGDLEEAGVPAMSVELAERGKKEMNDWNRDRRA